MMCHPLRAAVATLFLACLPPVTAAAAGGGTDLADDLALDPPVAFSAAVADYDDTWWVEPRLSYSYGAADGLLQTPSGGEPGTTSPGRPTLDELGIDDATVFDVSARGGYDVHEVYLGAQFVRLSGDATLAEPLVSQGNLFPPGTRLESDVALDWYRVGYGYRFTFDLNDDASGPELSLTPSAGFALLDFSKEIEGSNGADVRRSYSKGTVQVGARAAWELTRRLSIAGEVLSSVPIEDYPFILMTELTATYALIDSDEATLDLTLGVAYETIRYDDEGKQPVPNEIEVDLGPMLVVGLRVGF